MARMRPTQIYLPEDLAAALDRIAKERGTSRAEVIRQAARLMVERRPLYDDDPILGIVGMVDGGPEGASDEHDRYLAEGELRRWR